MTTRGYNVYCHANEGNQQREVDLVAFGIASEMLVREFIDVGNIWLFNEMQCNAERPLDFGRQAGGNKSR